MRPHAARLTRTIYCVGNGRLVRELAPLLENAARVRWAADGPTLCRFLASGPSDPTATTVGNLAASGIIACIAEDPDHDRLAAILETVRQRQPLARRLIVADACDAKMIRRFIEPELSHAIIYRPLEISEVRKAIGLPVLSRHAPAARSASLS